MLKKKILILGSAGQIGSYLEKYLKQKNIVYKFDLVNSPKEDLRNYNNQYFINILKKSDFIFFLAFDVGGSRYLEKYQNSYYFIDNNIKIMNNVFSKIKKFKKKFIFASSQMSNMNYSNYGILKSIGEKYSEVLGGLVVKFWNVYGIEKDLNKSHVITDFILQALNKQKIKMLTNGQEFRDFLYAEDCCKALEIMMNKYNQILPLQKTIDLATGKYVKIIDVAKIVKKIMIKKNLKIEIIPSKKKDKVQKNKKNYPNRFFFSYWKPEIKLETGIKKIFEYYQMEKKY